MLKNVVSIALGLFIASRLGLAANVAYRLATPYKQEDRIKDLPPFSLSQNYENNEALLPALVRIEQPETFFHEQQFNCSGTVISDDYVLTAAHCVGGMEGKLESNKVLIISIGGSVVEAVPASMNARADYALIKGDFKGFNKLRVLPNLEKGIGSVFGVPQVLTCGFPWGATDVCYGAKPLVPYLQFIALQGLLYPGMSGGPVIEPQSMIVVGVNSMMLNDGAIAIAPLVGLFQTLHVEVVP
jgi:S1-C subfamily serine protease